MGNPFSILMLLFKCHKPSKIAEMKAVKNGFWLGKNYTAMMFFGHILTHTQKDADRINKNSNSIRRHETIHLRQAQSTHNSWICFYWLYTYYFFRALPQNRHMKGAAYRINPFEMEAYEHMYDAEYIDQCKTEGAQEWREYAKLKPSERLSLYKSRLNDKP